PGDRLGRALWRRRARALHRAPAGDDAGRLDRGRERARSRLDLPRLAAGRRGRPRGSRAGPARAACRMRNAPSLCEPTGQVPDRSPERRFWCRRWRVGPTRFSYRDGWMGAGANGRRAVVGGIRCVLPAFALLASLAPTRTTSQAAAADAPPTYELRQEQT